MMTRSSIVKIITGWILVFLGSSFLAGQATTLNRQTVVAGTFYPAGKQALESTLEQLFAKAVPVTLAGRVQSLVVPHAGYSYSGMVAASGYKSIPGDSDYENIFIIASSHRELFQGASVYSVGNYLTPLGEAHVNRQIAQELIDNNKSIYHNPAAHNREHSIEVQVPFIQYHFTNNPFIVPIVIGSSSVGAARDLAKALLPYYKPENLFIISSDFSHYPAYKEAKRIDGLTGEAILKNNPELFYNTLRKNSSEPVQNLSTPCCGWSSVLTMLYMSEQKASQEFTPILYRNSGDSPIGDKDRVVGYWAIAGHEAALQSSSFGLNEYDKKALLDLSRNTLVSYLQSNELPAVSGITPGMKQEAGAFVSLYMDSRLRGCIGNFFAPKPLHELVQEMTVAAAINDRRFAPVESPELDYIHIEISVLTPLRKIQSIDEFELGKHGIYMTLNGRSGTYLPQVADDTGWTTEEFLGHCAREKAGIGWDGWKEADLFVYEAIVFGEEKGK